ncbi:MAG: hypothetical protein A6D92_14785, partial [Symbiobacterium thermophilum]
RRRGWPLLVVAALLSGLLTGLLVGRVAAQNAEPGTGGDPLVSKSYVDLVALYRVVEVPAGRKVIGEAGTELVVRGGQATAIDSALGGLLDVTAGTDIRGGTRIPPNHLLVVPRSDGRGLFAVTDLVLMVKGRITIAEP